MTAPCSEYVPIPGIRSTCRQWSMPTDLSYQGVGATRLDEETWGSGPRRMRWAVKTRSGFRVVGEPIAILGADNGLVFRGAGLFVRERVRVVGVVDQPSWRGSAHGA